MSNETNLNNNSIISVEKGFIQIDNKNVVLKGVNTLNSFGIDESNLLKQWNVKIVREFIGNLREQPISGYPIKDSQNKFLHSLDSIVVQNRSQGIITILCPFGWVFPNGEQQLLTGLNPSEQIFFNDYKIKMREIASFFKGKNDVWIQVWNEPYTFNNSNGYTHNLWLEDHIKMIANLRNVDGFNNIIIATGNEQGQGEAVLLEKGKDLMSIDDKIIFDLHAYGKWHDNSTQEEIEIRLQKLITSEIPIIFGEVGVITEEAALSDPTAFLAAINQKKIGALAWLWNKNSGDQNSLLTDIGKPNDNNNNTWGSKFKAYLDIK
ncbi:MAG: glycoside hydrolase family 5 protein [Cellulophaga sp.]|nr:glycoside hydrolase family 5 protein [Cellulophaga sp.]